MFSFVTVFFGKPLLKDNMPVDILSKYVLTFGGGAQFKT